LTLPALAHAAPATPDPWEGFNRKSFAFSQAIDKHALRPVALAYLRIVPAPIRDGLHNIISNLSEPVVAANDILQGRFKRASLATARLAANTTIGIGGVFDVASKMGDPHHDNGFDITLGRYHIGAGPYLYIPILGPSTVRNVVGFVADSLADPLGWTRYPDQTAISISRGVVGGVDLRAQVDGQYESLLSEATDPYATLRSVYLQNEQSLIDAGKPLIDQPLPDFGDPGQNAPTPAPPPNAAPATSTLSSLSHAAWDEALSADRPAILSGIRSKNSTKELIASFVPGDH
jgi:phospholipid-binding lipoprotein MlaA